LRRLGSPTCGATVVSSRSGSLRAGVRAQIQRKSQGNTRRTRPTGENRHQINWLDLKRVPAGTTNSTSDIKRNCTAFGNENNGAAAPIRDPIFASDKAGHRRINAVSTSDRYRLLNLCEAGSESANLAPQGRPDREAALFILKIGRE